jgi:hypothetical protein
MSPNPQADLIVALDRDVRWLHGKLKEVARAKALSADSLRERVAEILETAERRRKKTLST